MTGNEPTAATNPEPARPQTPQEAERAFRLRPERSPVTRLSRKVLAGGMALALLLIGGAVLWALQNNRPRNPVPDELYSTDHHNVADGLTQLPRDYAGIPHDVPSQDRSLSMPSSSESAKKPRRRERARYLHRPTSRRWRRLKLPPR